MITISQKPCQSAIIKPLRYEQLVGARPLSSGCRVPYPTVARLSTRKSPERILTWPNFLDNETVYNINKKFNLIKEVNVMKKTPRLFVFAVLLTVLCISVGYSQKAQCADKVQISIGAGKPGAVLYPTAVAMATAINRENPGYNAIAEETGGARENIALLMNKKIELGGSIDSVALAKYDGHSILYGFFAWNTDVEIVVLKGSEIEKMEDLRGKKVSLGPPGSAANTVASKLLKAYGLEKKDYKAQFLGWEKASDAMLDGLLDAATFMGMYPVASLQKLAMRKPIRVLGIDPALIKQHFGAGFHPFPIAADEYTDRNVSVIAMSASVYIRGDLEEEVVYNCVKAVFSNIDYVTKVHRAGKQFRILSQKELEALGVKAHPGVVRYAKEKGLW